MTQLKNILKFIKKVNNTKLIKLDIGCGKNKKEGFVGVDIDPNSKADIIASALDLPLKDNSVDEIQSLHLVEHFFPEDKAHHLT